MISFAHLPLVRRLTRDVSTGPIGSRRRSWWAAAGLVWLLVGLELSAATAPRVRIGVENSPQGSLSTVDEHGRASGFTGDLLRSMAQTGGIDFEIVPGSWSFISSEFRAGRLDVLANVTITDDRLASMDFSITHAYLHGVVYFRPGQPAIRRTADLAGLKIAVLSGTLEHQSAVKHQGWGGTVVALTGVDRMFEALARGDCDVVLLTRRLSAKVIKEHGLQSEFLDDVVHQFHFAVHKGDSQTLARLNEALATVRHDGTFDRIYARWIGPIEPHPIRLADLRPFFLPGAIILLGVVVVFWWQRHMLSRVAQQAGALRQSEERWKFAIEGSRDGMWDWNIPAGEVLRSSRWKEMLGFTDREIGSRPAEWSERVHPEDRPRALAAVQAHHAGNTPTYANEHRLRCKDGQWKWFLDRGLVVSRAADGEPLRMIGTVTDISERKAGEAKVQQLNTDLERRVQERTAELEIANRELEAFAYTASHDLRAPLRNIYGFLELLSQRTTGQLDPESARYVATVSRETARLSTLIDKLLAFSRISRIETTFQAVPLAEIVQDVQRELDLESCPPRVEWRIAPLPVVTGDRTLLHQVLSNLLGNAVKFTRGRPTAIVEIGTVANAEPGKVTIFVRDNGAGFNPKYRDKLFGVFQRLHTAREFDGVGIGLAIVKRIVERHDGTIWAQGEVDQGATFFFTLTPVVADRTSPR